MTRDLSTMPEEAEGRTTAPSRVGERRRIVLCLGYIGRWLGIELEGRFKKYRLWWEAFGPLPAAHASVDALTS